MNKCHLYITECHALAAFFYFSRTTALWLEETRYNPLCDADEESSCDMLSEELDTDYDDQTN
jgi:hypothetical protein